MPDIWKTQLCANDLLSLVSVAFVVRWTQLGISVFRGTMKHVQKMHLRCINHRRIPMAILSSFYQNWKRIEQTGKVIVKWRHAWILLTVCETHWALMFFADPWTSLMKSCIACSPIILRAWQSFEWVRFHANLTGVQVDQYPYFQAF